MRRRIRNLLLGAAAVAPAPLAAQRDFLSAVQYSMAVPLGDSYRFSPHLSWSGLAWEMRWVRRPHTSIGTMVGFNEFYRRDSGTMDFPQGAGTGEQYRNVFVVPMLVTGGWYFNANRDDPRWYVGGGAGPQFTGQIFQLGLHEESRGSWSFVLVPEVGLSFPIWDGSGGIASLRYHFPTKSSAILGGDDRRYQYLSLSIGIGYR